MPSRILFKTGSTNLYDQFPQDFPSITAECIEYLAKLNVILLGVDTPSIDSAASKDLPAHHACHKYGLHIIEGLDLTEVQPGLYTLVALPLKLEGLDASPVRAILIKNNSIL